MKLAQIWGTTVQSQFLFNWIHKPFVHVLVVLFAGDPGDGHRGWDRYRLDHEEQDRSHTICGHSWILTGSAADDTGKSQTHAHHVFERNLFSVMEMTLWTHSLFLVYRQGSTGCYWWTTMLLVSLWSSSPASCASASCMFMVRRQIDLIYADVLSVLKLYIALMWICNKNVAFWFVFGISVDWSDLNIMVP